MTSEFLTKLLNRLPQSAELTEQSNADSDYNCVAWAVAADKDNWWWPITYDDLAPAKWISESGSDTLEHFIEAMRSIGFEIAEDASVETGFHKIAIYAKVDRTPTHMARQLDNGRWVSKLGSSEDVEHVDVNCFRNEIMYGEVHTIMKRADDCQPTINLVPARSDLR